MGRGAQNKQTNEDRNKTLRVSEALGIWERNTLDYGSLLLACLESVGECWPMTRDQAKSFSPDCREGRCATGNLVLR